MRLSRPMPPAAGPAGGDAANHRVRVLTAQVIAEQAAAAANAADAEADRTSFRRCPLAAARGCGRARFRPRDFCGRGSEPQRRTKNDVTWFVL